MTDAARGTRTQLFEVAYERNTLGVTSYDVTRDGRTFAMLQRVRGAEQSVFVTLNWFDRLRAPGR